MDLISHMMANGVQDAPHVVFDGRVHRFRASGKSRNKNGWYIAFDNPQTVVYGDWREPDIKHTWKPENQSAELTPAQKAEIEKKRKAAFDKQLKQRTRNAQRWARVWEALQPCVTHQYLNNKQVGSFGSREYRSKKRHLLVNPMRNFNREVVGLQLIYPNGFKRYAKGSQSKQVYFGLGQPNGLFFIAEGYATGATIHAVTGHAVVVCFSAGNIKDAAIYLKRAYPDSQIIIAADNDRWSKINTIKGIVDNPGLHYAREAAELINCEYRLPQFQSLETKPTDFNDLYVLEGDNAVRLYLEKLHYNIEFVEQVSAPEVEYEFNGNTFEVDEQPIQQQVTQEPQKAIHDGKFKCLGFDEENFYFMPAKTNKLVKLNRGQTGSKTHLLSIAPLEWWMDVFFNGATPKWEFATDYLMRCSEKAGIFDVDKMRGAGAWFDNGRSVFHMGARLLVDGELLPIDKFNSRFIYELGRELDSGLSPRIATDEECHKVIRIFQQINFDRPLSALLTAGWSYLAPVCGALEWRPHLWMIGARGTGKSWIQSNIIEPIVGNVALKVASSSTEAGIRQSLLKDARPVMFDEAEAEDISSRKRMQGVIELARQASSAGNAQITKGSASGQAMSFSIRSMFMFGSINASIKQASDESRIAVVSLKPNSKDVKSIAAFNKFAELVDSTLTDELCSAVRARAYRDIPKLRRNARIMAKAVAESQKSQRIGDQYGALLAGAFGLYSNMELDIDMAREWVSKLDFTEVSESEAVRDEENLMTTLLQAEIRAEIGGIHIVKSLAELLNTLRGEFDSGIPQHEIHGALGRYGFAYENENLLVSNKHEKIGNILRNTAWADNWARVLVRVDGASKSVKSQRIGGVVTRFVSVPIGMFL